MGFGNNKYLFVKENFLLLVNFLKTSLHLQIASKQYHKHFLLVEMNLYIVMQLKSYQVISLCNSKWLLYGFYA